MNGGSPRGNSDGMIVRFKEQEVWRAEKRGHAGPIDATYRVLGVPETIRIKSD